MNPHFERPRPGPVLVSGNELVGLRYEHPLPSEARGKVTDGSEIYRIVAADYVTMDTGTGLVHTAPGHGEDDFRTGQREGLPVLSPVDAAGRFTDEVQKYSGRKVLEANKEIIADLKESGALVHLDSNFRHEYPHCWRCHNPVIFRATEQWFIDLEPAATPSGSAPRRRSSESAGSPPGERSGSAGWSRTATSGACPASGAGARRSRCSGAKSAASSFPIPRGGTPPRATRSSRRVAEVFREHGADAWFDDGSFPPSAFLPAGATPTHSCGGTLGEGERHPRRLVRLRRVARSGPQIGSLARAALAGRRLRRRPRPAPRVVPVVAADVRRPRGRARSVRHGAHPRLRRRRRRAGRCRSRSATSSRRRTSSARDGADILRLWVLGARLPGRPAAVERDPRADFRRLPEDPEHRALPALRISSTSTRSATRSPDAALRPLDRWAAAPGGGARAEGSVLVRGVRIPHGGPSGPRLLRGFACLRSTSTC